MFKRLRLWWKGICRNCESERSELGYSGYCFRCYNWLLYGKGVGK